MTFKSGLGFIVWTVLVVLGQSTSGSDLMLQVGAGREECFFENAEVNKTLYVDYSVVGTNQGELDINFQLSDTLGRPLITEFRRTDSHHEVPITITGFYKLCFDNTFSHFSHKTVAFTVTVENENDVNWSDYDEKNFQPEGVYEMQVNDIKGIMERVRVALNKIEGVQDSVRLVETKDRSIAESNFERVNFWSMFYMIVLIGVGMLQVLLVKSLFDDKYGVIRYMKKFKG